MRAEVEDIEGCFAPDGEISLYRLIQESVNNILKHSEASAANISIRANSHAVRITIQDDGRGFDPQKLSVGTGPGGFGLVGIVDRIRLLGGRATIRSTPGEGTTLEITLVVINPGVSRCHAICMQHLHS